MVSEVTAVGKYAGRPLKAGDAAQLVGCSARFVPAVFGPFGSAVHRMLDLVYGMGEKCNAVHGMGCLVYGDKDYDENGQEKGTYFGRWGWI